MKLKKLIAAALLAGCASSAMATASVKFLIDGDTFSNSFKITNLSDKGERITSFSLTLPTGFVFDTVSDTNNFGRYVFAAANDFDIDKATSTAPADGGASLEFGFGNAFTTTCPITVVNFTPCEFGWTVDVDGNAAMDMSVLGNQLNGAAVSARFSDGSSAMGFLGGCPATECTAAGAYWSANGALPPPNQTPEPGSLALAGLALLAAGALRARKV